MKIPQKVKIGIILFFLGFIGILTILTMEIPIPENVKNELDSLFTPSQFKIFVLINPTIFLLIFVTIGTLTYEKINLKIPVFEKIATKNNQEINYNEILKFGIFGGILSGITLTLITYIFHNSIPAELQNFQPNILNRFFYGGITEEILMRFGIMTFIIWFFNLIFKNQKSWIYWVGIIISSLLFGVGHLPIVKHLVPELSTDLIIYIVLGNSIGGIIFGWLYWKKGLEASMIAHIITHIIFIIFLNIKVY